MFWIAVIALIAIIIILILLKLIFKITKFALIIIVILLIVAAGYYGFIELPDFQETKQDKEVIINETIETPNLTEVPDEKLLNTTESIE